MSLQRRKSNQQHKPSETPPPSPDSRPLVTLRTLVILTIAIGAALLIASHPAIALPVGVGVTILAILTKITGD